MKARAHSGRLIVILALISTASMGVAAQETPPEDAPEIFQAVTECLAIVDAPVRLACYDRSVKALEVARADNEVIVADREQVREAKRGLFGLSLPDLKLFSRDEDDQITEIESTVRSLSQTSEGKWLFTLQDGVRWMQTDIRDIRPKVGSPIRIRQAAMGSYLANVGGNTAIRVKRVES